MTTLKISALHYKLDWDMTEKSNRNTYIWDIYIYIYRPMFAKRNKSFQQV